MSQEVKTLMEMGFSEEKSKNALAATNFSGVEIAMEWLLAHSHEFEPTASELLTTLEDHNTTVDSVVQTSSPVKPSTTSSTSTPIENNSSAKLQIRFPNGVSCTQIYSCTTKFSEVKLFIKKKLRTEKDDVPIMTAFPKRVFTYEDNERDLNELGLTPSGVIIVGRTEQEKEEFSERDRRRILAEKEEKEEAKRVEKAKVQKVVDDKKREMEEEKKIKERILAEIEQDKANRRIRAAGTNPNIAKHIPAEPQASSPVVVNPTKIYPTTSLQIRGPDGSATTKTFDVTTQFSEVKKFITEKYSQHGENFVIMTAFPRKEFTAEDYCKTLNILGLVPSAVIIVKKPQV